MVDGQKKTKKNPRIVGNFIRKRREKLGISQRALGQRFSPTVTTQFISNLERGVTPLPPAHVPALCEALQISDAEIKVVLEQEYAAKLSGKLGIEPSLVLGGGGTLNVSPDDYKFITDLYDAYQRADSTTRQAFQSAVKSILTMSE